MAQVTSPIILDSTGQQIHSDLQQIKNVLTTPSAAADITFDNTGTGMQADDVQDAITELKSNLTDKKITKILSRVTSISTTATSYNLSDSLANYDAILFTFYYGNNLIKTATIPLDYFLTTTSSGRLQTPLHTSDGTYQGTINSYHNTNTSLYLQSRNNTTATSMFGVAVHGIKY